MKYTQVRPCPHCPFRTDIPGYLRGSRAREIAVSLVQGGEFPCHETTVSVEEDDGDDLVATEESQHCAGALIVLERMEQPNQMMRICERLGFYDMRKLDMSAPVAKSLGEFIAHHQK